MIYNFLLFLVLINLVANPTLLSNGWRKMTLVDRIQHESCCVALDQAQRSIQVNSPEVNTSE